MKKRRIISLLFIIVTGVFASFYGGSFSYALFFICFTLPLSSLLYVFYIFFRLKVYQSIDTKITVKGDKIPYKFMVVNEDFIFYKEINLSFISNYSKIDLIGLKQSLSLNAGEREVQETELVCLYRGEYKVGIKSIEIKDILGLFSLNRKYPSEMNIRVFPRIVKLGSLAALSLNEDVKISPFSYSDKKEIIDSELREYVRGDNPRTINWKVSAKYNKLFTRKYTEKTEENIEIFLDLSAVDINAGEKIALEDKMLETALGISNYYLKNSIKSRLNFFSEKEYSFNMAVQEEFKNFYDSCLDLSFNNNADIGEYINQSMARKNNVTTVIVITTAVTDSLGTILNNINSYNISTSIILNGNKETDELGRIRNRLAKTNLVHIAQSQEITDVLEKPKLM